MYKATKEIGGYKVGDTVPDAKAITWLAQYDIPHVELVKEGKKVSDVSKDKTSTDKVASKKGAASDALLDDYLNRNSYVVVKNVRKDKLTEEQIEKMIDIEKNNKNRNKVLKALRAK